MAPTVKLSKTGRGGDGGGVAGVTVAVRDTFILTASTVMPMMYATRS